MSSRDRRLYLHISYIVHTSATCTDTRAHASECRAAAFAEYTLVIFLRAHRLAFCVRTRARIPDRASSRAPIYGPKIVYVRARYTRRCEDGEKRERVSERERERRGEYFVRFRSTGCNGGEPHCWPVSRPRLLGRQRRRRRWWRRWWSRRTSCRRTACLKGRAVLLAASTHTIPPRACAIRFACHRGERGVNFNTITLGHRASRG